MCDQISRITRVTGEFLNFCAIVYLEGGVRPSAIARANFLEGDGFIGFRQSARLREVESSVETLANGASNPYIYEEQFSKPQNLVLEEKTIGRTPVELPLDYVRSADVVESTIFDFTNKTLVVEFKQPMRVASTLEGERNGILAVGNHYSPPPCWSITHRLGLEQSRRHIYQVIGKSTEESSFLFTGADVGNLSVQKKTFKDLAVYALVTAGVGSNAVRMAMDEGRFYEPGTINVIVLTNIRLTPRAMARVIISATEAKTAALQDLDVRSCAFPQKWQATGTGTDEELVVEGTGTVLDNAGSHSKLGELIAAAVYAGVTEAVHRQNGIAAQRSVFRRLQEKHINPYGLLQECSYSASQADPGQTLVELEALLLQPRYAAFLETSLALSDAYDRNLIADLTGYDQWRRGIAEEIAGGKIADWKEMITAKDMPVVLRMFLDALLNGLSAKISKQYHNDNRKHSRAPGEERVYTPSSQQIASSPAHDGGS